MSNQEQHLFQQQLYELDCLYHTAPLTAHEVAWCSAITQLQRVVPTFTIAYAEIFNAGKERKAHGSMRHVLLPIEGNIP